MWLAALLAATALYATIFGSIHGLIHDPQHRPVAGATVTVFAQGSNWKKVVTSNDLGEFQFDAVPLGAYSVDVSAPGFGEQVQQVNLTSGAALNVHFALEVATAATTVEVKAAPAEVPAQSATSETVVSRDEIARTPGADRANSMAMITDYVPSAYIVHDQLHLRGGHAVEWLLDGVPVPNTSLATNVGPQFDPKDVAYLEVQRGGMGAEYGDRTYGSFNVVTRSGFERDRQAELITSYGNFHTTDDQLNFGSHSDRFAYYTSVAGNRTDLGLETPTPAVLHDLGSGLSAFVSLIFNRTPVDQLRLVAAVRGDHYQVPNTPEQQAAGIADVENERDGFANLSWVRQAAGGWLLTVSPFFHLNRAHYAGSVNDDHHSDYAGGVVTVGLTRGRHNFRAGVQSYADGDSRALFGAREQLCGDTESVFVEEQFKPASWLALNGGIRFTRFAGGLHETATDPRVGAAVTVPLLKWSVRAFYGRYYQAPPLLSIGGPLSALAEGQGFDFLPLHGERDEQTEVGVTIPFHGWAADIDGYRTAAKNFFDHDVLGNSNIFFPLTIARARIHGWEATLRSPRIAGRFNVHLAYARQWAQGQGGVTGGLTDFMAPESNAYYFLDHDQRDTLSTGVNVSLPWNSWAAVNVAYGSGFLDGDGPGHLPPHTTADVALGKSFERWSVQVSALNVGNRRFLLDNSNTFGGTHWANPREISVQVRYRFRY